MQINLKCVCINAVLRLPSKSGEVLDRVSLICYLNREEFLRRITIIQYLNVDAGRILRKTGTHTYIIPHKLLRPYIAHYTIAVQGSEPVSDSLVLMPDASGCIVCPFDGTSLQSRFWGPTTKTVIVCNDINTIPLKFFIEFLPGGAWRFTGIPQNELTDLKINTCEVDSSLYNDLNTVFEASLCLQDFIDGLDRIFLLRLFKREDFYHTADILFFVRAEKKICSVRELAAILSYSERHLNRIFGNTLGMNIKTYIRLQRINAAIKYMKIRFISLTAIAHESGYYDQSHFIHDFKSVCGVTPTEYIKNMSIFYNEDYKFSCII